MPAMPEGRARTASSRGSYKFKARRTRRAEGRRRRAQLIGSGAILNEVVKAQALLDEVRRRRRRLERDQLQRAVSRRASRRALEPAASDARPRECRTVAECLGETAGVVVAASDYLKSQPDMISRWVGRPMVTLGTDGFGRSEDRASLRDFFEVDAQPHRRGDAVGACIAKDRSTRRSSRRRSRISRSIRTRTIRRLRRARRGAAAQGTEASLTDSVMATEVTLPELGENVEKGDVVRVLVNAGDVVKADQPVVELETDKATIEVPSIVRRDGHRGQGQARRQGQGRPGRARRSTTSGAGRRRRRGRAGRGAAPSRRRRSSAPAAEPTRGRARRRVRTPPPRAEPDDLRPSRRPLRSPRRPPSRRPAARAGSGRRRPTPRRRRRRRHRRRAGRRAGGAVGAPLRARARREHRRGPRHRARRPDRPGRCDAVREERA